MPSDKVKPPVVFAVVPGEAAEFDVEFEGVLDGHHEEEFELPGLVYEVEELFVFPFEILVEVSRVEIDGSFVQSDVESDITGKVGVFFAEFRSFPEVGGVEVRFLGEELLTVFPEVDILVIVVYVSEDVYEISMRLDLEVGISGPIVGNIDDFRRIGVPEEFGHVLGLSAAEHSE
jgi:hypothetical protein